MLMILMHGWNCKKKINEFEQQSFNPWNQQWANVFRTNNVQSISNHFENANAFFGVFDQYLSENRPKPTHSVDVENLKSTMLESIESDFISMKTEMLAEIRTGISEVLGLKAELGLEQNYQQKIDSELTKSIWWRNLYVVLFVVFLLLGPVVLFFTFFSNQVTALTEYEKWFIRIALGITLVALTYFFFNQYRLYQLISLRYSHMNGFLGGGATFVSQIIGSEDRALKAQMNREMASLFMDLNDIYGLVRKDNHPMDKTADRLEGVVKEAISSVNKADAS